jgi:hypothetical protein
MVTKRDNVLDEVVVDSVPIRIATLPYTNFSFGMKIASPVKTSAGIR